MLKSPLWNSKFFQYGLVGIGLGIFGLIFLQVEDAIEEIPSMHDLAVLTGVVSRVERHGGRISSHHLFLKINDEEVRLNLSQCRFDLNLGEGDKQKIQPNDIVSVRIFRKKNMFGSAYFRVWQVEKGAVILCSHERLVRNEARGNMLEEKASIIIMLRFR